nr:site-specific integrase [Sulfolobus islandicus]
MLIIVTDIFIKKYISKFSNILLETLNLKINSDNNFRREIINASKNHNDKNKLYDLINKTFEKDNIEIKQLGLFIISSVINNFAYIILLSIGFILLNEVYSNLFSSRYTTISIFTLIVSYMLFIRNKIISSEEEEQIEYEKVATSYISSLINRILNTKFTENTTTIGQDKQLYDSFKTPKIQYGAKVPVKLEEIKEVAKNIEHIPSKAYFVLLAESGLRPGELLNVSIENIDLKARIIWINKETQTKRAYFSFFSRKTAEFLEKVYLPAREEFIRANEKNIAKLAAANENQEIDLEKWKAKLFPYKDDVLRRKIYEAMDRALGKRFELYALRRHFATYMQLKKVPPLAINILQGRVGPNEFRILKENYTVFTIEDLRKLYDEAGLVVLE